MSEHRFQLDMKRVRRRFDANAGSYEQAAVLQKEVRERLLERLEMVKLRPGRILDAGCGTGRAAAALARRYRRSQITTLDLSPAMLGLARKNQPLTRRFHRICGDMASLPLASNSHDLVFCSLALPWCDDLDRVFAEFARILRPGGLLTFATFGPDTLVELRRSWASVDRHNHVNLFVDLHDVGDALLRAGLDDPVMDVEQLTLRYTDFRSLLGDLRILGGGNATGGRPRGLSTPRQLHRLQEAYGQFRQDGYYPASHELVYGHAWGAPPRQRRGEHGETLVPLSGLHKP